MSTSSNYHARNMFFLWTHWTATRLGLKAEQPLFWITTEVFRVSALASVSWLTCACLKDKDENASNKIWAHQGVNQKKLSLGGKGKKKAKGICNKIEHFYLFLGFHTILFSFLTTNNESQYRVYLEKCM